MKNLFLAFITFALVFFVTGKSVMAQEANFTSCLTPNGEVMANYADGVHGIIGQGSQNGSDTVYSLANENAMQCFCGSNGEGIQTNWLNAGQLSSDEIKVYQNQGYIYVPGGTPWGLSDNPYLAQNINYSCISTSIVQSSHGDGLSDGRSDGLSDGKSSTVQADKTTASSFGLASTGNIVFVIFVLTAGIVLFLAGLFLKKKNG